MYSFFYFGNAGEATVPCALPGSKVSKPPPKSLKRSRCLTAWSPERTIVVAGREFARVTGLLGGTAGSSSTSSTSSSPSLDLSRSVEYAVIKVKLDRGQNDTLNQKKSTVVQVTAAATDAAEAVPGDVPCRCSQGHL